MPAWGSGGVGSIAWGGGGASVAGGWGRDAIQGTGPLSPGGVEGPGLPFAPRVLGVVYGKTRKRKPYFAALHGAEIK